MATIGDINLQEPSTITKRLAAVQIDRNSTSQFQEVMVLGSPNSTTTLALAEVMGSAPASTTVGLVVRALGDVTIRQSTASDLNCAVSSVGGAVIVRSSAANALVSVYQSSAADLAATVTLASSANSVLARVTTSSGGSVEGSTSTPPTGAMGLHVRPVHPELVTFCSTAGSATVATVVSSAATTAARVTSFSIASTISGPVDCGFYSGSTLLYPLTLWSDGGFMNHRDSTPAPSYLFAGSTGQPLTFNMASTGHVRISVTYFTGA